MRTSKTWALCALLLTSGAGLSWAVHSMPVPSWQSSTKAVSAGEGAAANGAPGLREPPWPPGEQREYTVTMRTRMEGHAEAGPQVFELEADLRLTLLALRRDADALWVRGHFAADGLRSGEPQRLQEWEPDARAGLLRPFVFELSPRGAIARVHLEPQVDAPAQGILRNVLSSLQLVRADDATSRRWTVEEADSSGRYTATYAIADDGRVHKQTGAYKAAEMVTGLLRREETRSANSVFTLAPDATLRAIERRQDDILVLADTRLVSTTTTALQLRRSAHVGEEPLALAGLVASELDALPQSNGTDRARAQRLADQKTVPELATWLDTLSESDEQARRDTLEQMVAVLKLGGATAAESARVAVRSASPQAASTIMGALEAAGTPDCQRALDQLAGDPELMQDQRVTALMHLGRSEHPTAESLRALRARAHDPQADRELRDVALMALGGALRADALGADPAAAEEAQLAFSELLDGLRNARAATEAANYLGALGNTGNPAALAPLSDYATHADPGLRANAVVALRHVAGGAAESVIVDSLAFDEEPAVRSSALRALLYREPTAATIDAVVKAIRGDQDGSVRRTAIGVAASLRDSHAEVAAVLQWAAENDPDPQVRQAAERYLGREAG